MFRMWSYKAVVDEKPPQQRMDVTITSKLTLLIRQIPDSDHAQFFRDKIEKTKEGELVEFLASFDLISVSTLQLLLKIYSESNVHLQDRELSFDENEFLEEDGEDSELLKTSSKKTMPGDDFIKFLYENKLLKPQFTYFIYQGLKSCTNTQETLEFLQQMHITLSYLNEKFNIPLKEHDLAGFFSSQGLKTNELKEFQQLLEILDAEKTTNPDSLNFTSSSVVASCANAAYVIRAINFLKEYKLVNNATLQIVLKKSDQMEFFVNLVILLQKSRIELDKEKINNLLQQDNLQQLCHVVYKVKQDNPGNAKVDSFLKLLIWFPQCEKYISKLIDSRFESIKMDDAQANFTVTSKLSLILDKLVVKAIFGKLSAESFELMAKSIDEMLQNPEQKPIYDQLNQRVRNDDYDIKLSTPQIKCSPS